MGDDACCCAQRSRRRAMPARRAEMVLPRNSHPDRREFVLRNDAREQQASGPPGVRFAKWCARATGTRTGGSSFCQMVRAGNRHRDPREFVFRASSLKIQIPYKFPGGERPVLWRRSSRAARTRESRSQPAASRAGRSPIIIAPERARTTHKHIKSCCGKRRTTEDGRQKTDDRRQKTQISSVLSSVLCRLCLRHSFWSSGPAGRDLSQRSSDEHR